MASSANQLLAAAREARKRAYCPHSGFAVGAAVEADDRQVFVGCNIENASYGLTICAERVAIFNAISRGARRIRRIAISCLSEAVENPDAFMPCGACRQVMREFMGRDAEVIVDGVGTFTLDILLPRAFCLEPKPARRTRRRRP